MVSKTRSTIEPKIGIGNSFFESKKQNFLLQSYQRDSTRQNLCSRKISSGKGFSGIINAPLTLLQRRQGVLSAALVDFTRPLARIAVLLQKKAFLFRPTMLRIAGAHNKSQASHSLEVSFERKHVVPRSCAPRKTLTQRRSRTALQCEKLLCGLSHLVGIEILLKSRRFASSDRPDMRRLCVESFSSGFANAMIPT